MSEHIKYDSDAALKVTPEPFGGARREKVRFGPGSTHRRTGQQGTTVTVTLGEKYPKEYRLLTHGRSAGTVATEIAALEARHTVKEEKIDGLRAAVGAEFTLSGYTFRVTDASVSERGTNTVLVLQVARLVGAKWERMSGMPLRRAVPSVDAVPDAAGAVLVARAHAAQWIAQAAQHEAFTTSVRALLAEEG